MIRNERLLIRADASSTIGTGHVMRMIALAQAWQDLGGTVACATLKCPDAIVERLHEEQIQHYALSKTTIGGENDARQTSSLARRLRSRWVVVDGYDFQSDYHVALRNNGLRIAAVDDYVQCERWEVDALLNQNIDADQFDYGPRDSSQMFFLGLDYVLLRREFIQLPKAPTELNRPMEKILITLGGADPDNASGALLEMLSTYSDQDLDIRVLCGVANPHRAKLAASAAGSHHSVEIISNVRDMPSFYRWADGVISAGGSTCWEWMSLGVPGAVVCIADNQRLNFRALKQRAMALCLGGDAGIQNSTEVANELANWIRQGGYCDSPDAFVLDSFGASRVATSLALGSGVSSSGLMLRTATMLDSKQLLEWRNDEQTRRSSRTTDVVDEKGHEDWLRQTLDSSDRVLLIAEEDGQAVGTVRLDFSDDTEISWTVAPSARAKGVGSRMLKAVTDGVEFDLVAFVRESNAPSLRMAKALGFNDVSRDGGFVKFLRTAR